MSALADYLRGKRVILVGPAAYLTGAGRGPEIDAYDVVVRMNMSYDRAPDLARDYGSRTDVLYHILIAPDSRALDADDVALMAADGVQWLVAKWDEDGRLRGRLAGFRAVLNDEFETTAISSDLLADVREELESEPHMGPLAIRHLLSFDIAELAVTGCDFYASGYQPGYGDLSADDVARVTGHAAASDQGEWTWVSRRQGSNVDRAAQMRMLARLSTADSRLRLDERLRSRMTEALRDMVTAIVPMKGDSERLPGKNIKPMLGRPLCWYVLDTLSRSNVGHIVVDTDSEAIAEVVHRLFPFVTVLDRPEHLRAPEVNGNPLTEWAMSQTAFGEHFLQTHVTNPLLSVESVNAAIDAYFERLSEHDSLFAVTERRSHFYAADGSPINHDPAEVRRTQDLPPIYEDNHCLYLFSRASFAVSGRIGAHPQMFQLGAIEAVDIDYEDDFALAEALMSSRSDGAQRRDKERQMQTYVYSTVRQPDGTWTVTGTVGTARRMLRDLDLGDSPTLEECREALRHGGVPKADASGPAVEERKLSEPASPPEPKPVSQPAGQPAAAPPAKEIRAEVAAVIDGNVGTVSARIAEIEDIDLLADVEEAEQAGGAPRRTVMGAIAARRKALSSAPAGAPASPPEPQPAGQP